MPPVQKPVQKLAPPVQQLQQPIQKEGPRARLELASAAVSPADSGLTTATPLQRARTPAIHATASTSRRSNLASDSYPYLPIYSRLSTTGYPQPRPSAQEPIRPGHSHRDETGGIATAAGLTSNCPSRCRSGQRPGWRIPSRSGRTCTQKATPAKSRFCKNAAAPAATRDPLGPASPARHGLE